VSEWREETKGRETGRYGRKKGGREGGREGGLTGVVVALNDSNGQGNLRHAEGVGLQGRVEGLGEVRLLLVLDEKKREGCQ